MDHGISIAELGRLKKQRNGLALSCIALLVVAAMLMIAASTRTREVILTPVNRSPLEISNSGVSAEYLEFITRDVALMTLNRSPENLNYWMESILEIASPRTHGELRRDLMAILDEQRGSSVSQYFTIQSIHVDPDSLTSEVVGTLNTIVGSERIGSHHRRFRFTWEYEGLTLRLLGFGIVTESEGEEDV